ncbi:retrotransposon protein [Cucumis melo var. makuwa]|uniref:Retrotransposon protein n=1 Tax=Cucumis melo var. makuwa TaxID=1194695 RepID=A0A5A7U1P9_CUCMM|nr:retrotransposon protein [Cucumis melo var. makuwa]TYK08089.1 retrotransposon protein [Cucumis melo var. makuwa]
MKLKGKMDETEPITEINGTVTDRSKYKKLEMPMFLGENPESWVYRAEHFFEINNLPESEKVKVAVVSFGQDEVDWYRWSHNRKKVESWEDLKSRMFEFFRDSGQKSLGARLIRIQQDGSYNEYVKKFVTYSAPLPYMAESVLVDAFVTGLEPSLQAEMELGMTKWEEGGSSKVKKLGDVDKPPPRKTDFQMKQITIPIKGNFKKGEPPVKRLSDAEFRARLDRGLCFRCNDKYSPGHR